ISKTAAKVRAPIQEIQQPVKRTAAADDDELLEYVNSHWGHGQDVSAAAPAADAGFMVVAEPARAVATNVLEPDESDERELGPQPAWMTVLEWMNAPFAAVPEKVRVAMG